MTSALHQRDDDGRPAIRKWQELMKPSRLVAMQPSRLSRSRAIMNKMIRERWDIRIERFDVDADAVGTVVYAIKTPQQEFSLIAFSFAPEREGRTGRIIGRAWDMMGTLNEGPATQADIDSARRNLPLLYRGRATANALVWCRCNRSMRAFDATLNALADGRQPLVSDINKVGYLMRNTGLDGNGTFGTRSFPSLGHDHALGGVLEAQMLLAYLMREFSCDLVDHLARLKSDKAVALAPEIRRYIGVGNGSALGLIFFIQKHPRLINAWIESREKAIASACGLRLEAGDRRIAELITLVQRAIVFRRQDQMSYETFASSRIIADELEKLTPYLEELRVKGTIDGEVCDYPLDVLARKAEQDFEPEGYETFLSLIVELVAEEADEMTMQVEGVDELNVDARMKIAELKALITKDYAWALSIDAAAPDANAYVWYKSETAEEPRRGERTEIPHARDLGLDMPGDIQQLLHDIELEEPGLSTARFLLKYPQHRLMCARVQSLAGTHFHTPQANINAVDFVPIQLVRLMNSAIHGIDKTRDYLQRNLRGVLFHGAPTTSDIRAGRGASWFYPQEPN
ncbi:MAG: hypothetical protein P1V21_16675 [Rhizobiaceae bacterium]|nr:hypothetical protein [Rhizobiaceae bacterium]